MTQSNKEAKVCLKKRLALVTSAVALGSLAGVAPLETSVEHIVLAATSQVNFLSKIAPFAQDLAGKNDLYASVMMAQAALESGYGSSSLSLPPYNNLFGIKGTYKGNSVSMKTLEDDGTGNYYSINDSFRSYPSYYESLADYVSVLKYGPAFDHNYYSGVFKRNTDNYKDATSWLTGRYATDTSYGTKLNQIIAQYGLTKYDTPSSMTSSKPSSHVSSINQAVNFSVQKQEVKPESHTFSSPSTGKQNSYKVKPGDGLWTVARALGTTIDAVKAANGLTSNLIFPGQILYAGSASSTKSSSSTGSSSSTISYAKPIVHQSYQTASKPTVSYSSRSYRVKPGDGLWTVARALGTTIDAVKAANGLTSNLIFPGQILYAGSSSVSAPVKKISTPVTSGVSRVSQASVTHTSVYPSVKENENLSSKAPASTYRVVAHDNLYRIALNHGVTLSALVEANGLGTYSALIVPGQILIIPAH